LDPGFYSMLEVYLQKRGDTQKMTNGYKCSIITINSFITQIQSWIILMEINDQIILSLI